MERKSANDPLALDDDFIADTSCTETQTFLQCAVDTCSVEITGILLGKVTDYL